MLHARSFAALAVVAATAYGVAHFARPADARVVDGLWSRYAAFSPESAPMSFYFFRAEDEIGLYRYGKIGFNNTHSYDYAVDGDVLVFTYRKTGKVVRVPFRLERERGKHPELVLTGDPQFPAEKETRYTFIPFERSLEALPDLVQEKTTLAPAADEGAAVEKIDNRVWIDVQKNAGTGGMQFHMYQLRTAGIDGRGTGWHHAGDFDDWTTESLTYRLTRGEQSGLYLSFTLRGESHETPFHVERKEAPAEGADGGAEGAAPVRFLTLHSDPREFWARTSLKDGGPAFASFVVDNRE